MDIEEIIKKRPYLRETLLLYKKVREFNDVIAREYQDSIQRGKVSYPGYIVDGIFQRFSEIFEIPMESLMPLLESMRLGQIDLTRLPHNEISGFLLPYHEDEIWMVLFIISKPFFTTMRRLINLDDLVWEDRRCPVCSSKPVITSLLDDGRRRLHCSYCGGSGFYKRLGCPVCGNFDMTKDTIITVDDEEGFRIEICDTCSSYVKTVREPMLNEYSVDLLDLISLPLDIIAQGRGYRRNAPNPIGMRRMA